MNYPCKSRYVTERSLNSIILHRRLEAPIDGKYFVNNIICDINLISTCQVSVRIFFFKRYGRSSAVHYKASLFH